MPAAKCRCGFSDMRDAEPRTHFPALSATYACDFIDDGFCKPQIVFSHRNAPLRANFFTNRASATFVANIAYHVRPPFTIAKRCPKTQPRSFLLPSNMISIFLLPAVLYGPKMICRNPSSRKRSDSARQIDREGGAAGCCAPARPQCSETDVHKSGRTMYHETNSCRQISRVRLTTETLPDRHHEFAYRTLLTLDG